MFTETLVSVEEYFDLLHKSDVKLEYHDGEIVAMAGAQPAHNRICINLAFLFESCLTDSDCMIYSSDQLIKVEGCNKYVFPDLVIVCKHPQFEKSPNGLDALENPEIIIEVLSDSTESYDRSEKFDCYKTISSFREYVLIYSKKKKILLRKKIQGGWLESEYTDKNEKVKIGDCEFTVDDFYKKVVFVESN
jgi:Uma2 family endonuclease